MIKETQARYGDLMTQHGELLAEILVGSATAPPAEGEPGSAGSVSGAFPQEALVGALGLARGESQ